MNKNNLLHIAANHNKSKTFELLAKKFPEMLQERNNEGKTPYGMAIEFKLMTQKELSILLPTNSINGLDILLLKEQKLAEKKEKKKLRKKQQKEKQKKSEVQSEKKENNEVYNISDADDSVNDDSENEKDPNDYINPSIQLKLQELAEKNLVEEGEQFKYVGIRNKSESDEKIKQNSFSQKNNRNKVNQDINDKITNEETLTHPKVIYQEKVYTKKKNSQKEYEDIKKKEKYEKKERGSKILNSFKVDQNIDFQKKSDDDLYGYVNPKSLIYVPKNKLEQKEKDGDSSTIKNISKIEKDKNSIIEIDKSEQVFERLLNPIENKDIEEKNFNNENIIAFEKLNVNKEEKSTEKSSLNTHINKIKKKIEEPSDEINIVQLEKGKFSSSEKEDNPKFHKIYPFVSPEYLKVETFEEVKIESKEKNLIRERLTFDQSVETKKIEFKMNESQTNSPTSLNVQTEYYELKNYSTQTDLIPLNNQSAELIKLNACLRSNKLVINDLSIQINELQSENNNLNYLKTEQNVKDQKISELQKIISEILMEKNNNIPTKNNSSLYNHEIDEVLELANEEIRKKNEQIIHLNPADDIEEIKRRNNPKEIENRINFHIEMISKLKNINQD